MTTIKPAPKRKFVTIRGSSKVDEDILNHIAHSKGISKFALQLKFDPPGIEQNSRSEFEDLHERTFKKVRRAIMKMFPASPEEAEFDVEARLNFLNSIGDPVEFQRFDINNRDHETTASIFERQISKHPFGGEIEGVDYDRSERIVFVSRKSTDTKKSFDMEHVAVLLDENIKRNNHTRHLKKRGNVTDAYFFVDFYEVATTRLLRQLIIDFMISRPDLAKYAVLDLYSIKQKLYTRAIDDDSLKSLCIDYAEQLGYVISDGFFGQQLAPFEGAMKTIMKGTPVKVRADDGYFRNKGIDLKFRIVIKEFLRYMNALQDKIENLSINRTAAARPYESKKNQTFEYIEREGNNYMLDFFDKVEIDAEVDLEHFDRVEKAFRKMFKKTPFPKVPGSSFRLRKLGREQASGMYYIEPKAVVVDFRNFGLRSFMHELLHHLDYTYEATRQEGTEALHDSIAFRDLYDWYSRRVTYEAEKRAKMAEKKQDNTSHFHTAWFGKTKYNKAYYLREEEVFARLGEMVMAYEFAERGIDKNVLFKLVDDFKASELYQVVYPPDNELRIAAKAYFQRVLPFLFLDQKG